MSSRPVTEEEIDAAAKLWRTGEFATSLALLRDMLHRVEDDATRMLLLFDAINCTTQLDDRGATEEFFGELEKLPQPEHSRVLANLTRANAEINLGRAENALALVETCLETGLFDRDDFRIHLYHLYFLKGKALERLSRWHESLEWLNRAHDMYPDEASCTNDDQRRMYDWIETEILFNKARCRFGLDEFNQAYQLSKQAFDRESGDTKTLAMMYMANSRFMQGTVTDALRLYVKIQKLLPCRTIQPEEVRDGMRRCMEYFEKQKKPGRPS
jgi:tetratricopeptide (TPR) repeat protein